jgi:hypothetical protein
MVAIGISLDEVLEVSLLIKLLLRETFVASLNLLVLLQSFSLFLSNHGSVIYVTDGKVLTKVVLILFNKVHDIPGEILGLCDDIGLINAFQE